MAFETISATDMLNYIRRANTLIIDLRTEEEYKEEHIEAAINIPYEDIEGNVEKYYDLMKKYYYIILYCERGNLSMLIAREMGNTDRKVLTLYGGINGFKRKLSIDGIKEIRHNN